MASEKSGEWLKLEIDGKTNTTVGFCEHTDVLVWNQKKAGSMVVSPWASHVVPFGQAHLGLFGLGPYYGPSLLLVSREQAALRVTLWKWIKKSCLLL